MKKAVFYVHGKDGSAAEAAHYEPLFPACDVIGLDYKSDTPWDCAAEFRRAADALKKRYDGLLLIANSIGAFFSMHAFSKADIERAWLISPIVDMEKLICGMMRHAGVSETRLENEKTVETPFGQTLSWTYLRYVRTHRIRWDVPTSILYGEHDPLTDMATVAAFAAAHGARLTVMPDGEHWFHTETQMRFLDDWIRESGSF